MNEFKPGEVYQLTCDTNPYGLTFTVLDKTDTHLSYVYTETGKISRALLSGKWLQDLRLVGYDKSIVAKDSNDFYMLFNPEGSAPKAKQPTKERAIEEANRLISKGARKVYILRTEAVVEMPKPVVSPIDRLPEAPKC